MTRVQSRQRRWVERWLSGIWACLLIAAWPTTGLSLTQDELDMNRDLWNSAGPESYDFFMQRTCFCAPDSIRPGLVEVRDGLISAVTDAETMELLDPQHFLTIDGLFEELQDALNFPAFDVQALFDGAFGYPTSISIDLIENAADDVVSYTVSNLTVVPEPASLALAIAGAGLGVAATLLRAKSQPAHPG
jgi:hypothetical protein